MRPARLTLSARTVRFARHTARSPCPRCSFRRRSLRPDHHFAAVQHAAVPRQLRRFCLERLARVLGCLRRWHPDFDALDSRGRCVWWRCLPERDLPDSGLQHVRFEFFAQLRSHVLVSFVPPQSSVPVRLRGWRVERLVTVLGSLRWRHADFDSRDPHTCCWQCVFHFFALTQPFW